jgi:hypothetical protein
MKKFILLFLLIVVSIIWSSEQLKAQHPSDSNNMALLGQNPLQARSAYQPLVHQQGGRWIAYIGHHGGSALNTLTGVVENNGTSILDVTNPRAPIYLHHLPGPSGVGEAGGAQMVRVCNGTDLPGVTSADIEGVFLLRTFGGSAHQVYDVRNPASPVLRSTPSSGLEDTHKSWWECDTGIAYLVSGVPGWRAERMTQVFDLSNPRAPVHIRDYGLVGQEPGSTGEVPTDLHGPISAGHRIYFGHGTSSNGTVQIVDRTKLLTGPPAPTPDNLRFPVISQFDTSPLVGAHTTFPILNVPVPQLGPFNVGGIRDILAIVNESTANECTGESHQMVFFADVTIESTPQVISNYHVPDPDGVFCRRGGRFGAHSSNENFTPIYYGKILFVAYFNAGVRAVDVRNPFDPKEVAYFVPATTSNTDPRAGKIAIQTNNVEVDNRGLIYIVDRANTGLHILELTGSAREIVNLPLQQQQVEAQSRLTER